MACSSRRRRSTGSAPTRPVARCWRCCIWGARISLFVGLLATAISMVIGTLVGLMSGFFEGWPARVLFRLTEWFLVIPFLPLALVLAAVLGRSLLNIVAGHRRHQLAGHGAADPQPDPLDQGAALPRAGPGPRRRPMAPDDAARAAQRDADGVREHHADGVDRDPHRDHAELPGPRGPARGCRGGRCSRTPSTSAR